MLTLIILSAIVTLVQTASNNAENQTPLPKQDWWESAVFYQIYVRSFLDTNGDGIGDISGVTLGLDHVKDAGVDAVILSPIFKSPNHDFGYDVSDYLSINPEYGTMEDFDRLLEKANQLNIKVILDFVPNHTSNESDWFIRSQNKDEYYKDWYIWANGFLDSKTQRRPPNNWVSVFGKSAWTYVPNRDQFYFHQFGETQPDLNYRNPVLVEEIKSIIKFWLEIGISGMRMSSVNYMFEADKDNFGGRYPDEPITGIPGTTPRHYDHFEHVYTKDVDDIYDMVSQFREIFDGMSLRNNHTRILIVEADTNIKNAVRYYGDVIHGGAHVPINYALLEDLDKDLDARDVKRALDKWMTYKPISVRANWIIGNHDTFRIASRFRPELIDAFNMLILLLPGIAFTYMGEEIGMPNGFVPWTETKDPLACNTDDPVNFVDVTRDPSRTPFQWNAGRNAGFSTGDTTWLPVAEGFEVRNVESESAAARSTYQLYRLLTNLRRRPAFKYGKYSSLAMNSDVLAFKRWYRDDAYVVVMNFGKTFHVVNLTNFDLIFGPMEVEASSVLSSRTYGDTIYSTYLDLAADEALVLRMLV